MTEPPAKADARGPSSAPAEANAPKEPIRYAPHLIFIRSMERVDQAMAAGIDPYPAFCAWQSAIAPWAWQDPIFRAQAQRLDTLLDDVFAEYGAIPRLEYVRAWRPLYIGVMRRAGMFPRMDNKKNAGKDRFSSKQRPA